MAHGDYNCCAVCDSKQAYAGFSAATKEEICGPCVRRLIKSGIDVATSTELVKWLEAKPDTAPLITAGFHMCYYSNAVDDAFKEANPDAN